MSGGEKHACEVKVITVSSPLKMHFCVAPLRSDAKVTPALMDALWPSGLFKVLPVYGPDF